MDIPRDEFVKQKKRKRRMLIAALGVTATIGVSLALARLDPVAPTVPVGSLLVDTVRHSEFVRLVRGPGTLTPRDVRSVAAQAPGRVERLLLKPGDRVEPDSVIAELSNPELERVVNEAAFAVTQGEAEFAALRLQLQGQLLDQKARVAEARTAYEGTRLQAVAEAEAKSAVSQLQLQRTRLLADQLKIRADIENERLANLDDTIRAQLRAQNARFEQLRSSLASQRQQLASLKITAGMKGVLQAVPVQEGQQLAAGAPIARVASANDLIATLRVPELQAKDLVAGLQARIDTRAGIIEGQVSRVDPGVEGGSVRVEVDLVGPLPAGSRPDLSVDGVIEIERVADAIIVGYPTYAQPEAQVKVFKLTPDKSRASRVQVQFGKASVNEIAVTSGLNPGDQIIVSDISQWSSYDEINIR